MANWFKIYETDLDETRMKFALSKLPEVWPVWTAVLMECCRHRKDSFPWGKDEQELFGFSDRLKISIPKVNGAVNILCEIRYVTIRDGTLTVLKWNEKQDDYLARKSRGYWEKRRESRSLTVNHSESHIEERRGEEIRVEEPKAGEREAAFPEIPDWPSVKAVADKIGVPEWKAEDWFHEMEGGGWLDYQGRRICKWQSVLQRVKIQWEAQGRPAKKIVRKVEPNGERAKSPMDLKTIIQAKETTAAGIRTKFCSDTAIDAVWSDNAKRQEFFAIKREIKQLTTQLSNMA
ncbi:MAG: hypothetical protein RIQ93_2481 [Verrucomicrobiota bacterium]|jgi:hypothetical protein